jgi:hypothetical protein
MLKFDFIDEKCKKINFEKLYNLRKGVTRKTGEPEWCRKTVESEPIWIWTLQKFIKAKKKIVWFFGVEIYFKINREKA